MGQGVFRVKKASYGTIRRRPMDESLVRRETISKDAYRAKLAKDVEAFLRAGGHIKTIPGFEVYCAK